MKKIGLFLLGTFLSFCVLAQGGVNGGSIIDNTISVTKMDSAFIKAEITAWAQAESFTLISSVRDVNKAIVTAVIQWPDHSTGFFTTDVASPACPGFIDAYHVTYVPVSGSSYVVTQSTITRDSSCAVSSGPIPSVN